MYVRTHAIRTCKTVRLCTYYEPTSKPLTSPEVRLATLPLPAAPAAADMNVGVNNTTPGEKGHRPRTLSIAQPMARGRGLPTTLYTVVALCARLCAWILESAAAAFEYLADSGKTRELPTVFVNVCVLNRDEMLAKTEGSVKAETAEKLQGLGPLAAIAADWAGKAAAGLAAATVSNTDLGMTVGEMTCLTVTPVLQQAGIQSEVSWLRLEPVD